ncbi:MAG: hypothetical protein JKY37_28245 [Nannocystaceae bacterium]|nr:hypothetical protein [Nannocystaceae bacterium]
MRHINSVLFVLAGLLTACIAEPFDGEVISQNPTTVIPRLSGYGTSLGQPIEISAKNASGGFDVVHDTAVTTGVGWTWAGTVWYGWQIDNFNLPAAYWTAKPFGCGETATIRAKVGDRNGHSLKQAFIDCWDPYQAVDEFINDCVSDNSPDVTIETCGALCC